VVFIEMDWTPGNNTQAEDRIHRIGQNETCHIHYFVYEDTVDAFIAKKVAEKRKTIAKILDEKVEIEKENLDIEMSKSEKWKQVQKEVLL
jgi:SNF2 family DNA or RNA helicase